MVTATNSGRTLAQGSAWTAFGQVVGALCGFATTIVSARILAPEDFGLLGVALLAISTLTALTQTGFDRALVQRRDAENYLNVAFTVQILRGFALASIVLALGYPVSVFYDEPTLFGIFAAMSGGVLAGGFRNAATVLFQRDLKFKLIVHFSILRAISKMITVVVLLLVLRNVWALVIGHVAGSFFDMIMSYFIQKKRPKWEWDPAKARELLQFGKWVSGMAVLGLVVTKGDDIFISKYLGMAALGLYSFAYEIANLPATNVTHVVGRVSFPTYARLYENQDHGELRQAFFNVMKATVLITAPLSAMLYLNIDTIVMFVIGPKWLPIIPLVKILVFAGFVRSVAALAAALFQGAGQPRLDFVMNFPRFVALTVLIWPVCAYAGLEGASWLTFFAVSTCLPTWFYGIRKIAGVSFSDLIRHNLLGFASTCVLCICFLIAERLVPVGSTATLALRLLVTAGIFAPAMWVLGRTTPLRLFGEVSALARALRKKPA